MNKVFRIFEPVGEHLHSKLTKSANKSQKKIIKKFNMGFKKRRISSWFQIHWKSFNKIPHKKVIGKNMTKICAFSLLLIFVILVLLKTLFWLILVSGYFFNGFEISLKTLRFLTPF
jgi:hypothetical protein